MPIPRFSIVQFARFTQSRAPMSTVQMLAGFEGGAAILGQRSRWMYDLSTSEDVLVPRLVRRPRKLSSGANDVRPGLGRGHERGAVGLAL